MCWCDTLSVPDSGAQGNQGRCVSINDINHPLRTYDVSVPNAYALTLNFNYVKPENWSEIRTHDLRITCALLYHLSYPVHVGTASGLGINHLSTHYVLMRHEIRASSGAQGNWERCVSINDINHSQRTYDVSVPNAYALTLNFNYVKF